jgi:VIT1/CCC1 family predicted Fe2+/Mn2+ transporter
MRRLRQHSESHLIDRIGWLRAAVLGTNDGILSTASLIVGVAAAVATQHDILIAGVVGLVAGAMSMAAGEYVSVSSQSDTEQAELARERKELIGAHARGELGISETLSARPIQAAVASAGSFAVGAAMPLMVAALAPEASLIVLVPITSLLFLALLGALAAGRRRRGRDRGRNTRHVLGCTGRGVDRRRRGLVRNSTVV